MRKSFLLASPLLFALCAHAATATGPCLQEKQFFWATKRSIRPPAPTSLTAFHQKPLVVVSRKQEGRSFGRQEAVTLAR